MSNFPTAVDDDSSIFRIDDNVTELAGLVINQLRDAVFSVENNLGLSLAGSLSDASTRLNISLNADGTIKASALSGIGLVTLPITNAQVGASAGILESKLSLNFGTSTLNTLIQAQSVLLSSLSAFEAALETKLNSHIAGGPESSLRHVASQLDLNNVPSDSRDPSYTWTGLVDLDGYPLSATTVAQALLEINNDLTGHQNQITGAHAASAISVDTSNFAELLPTSNNVQLALQNIDNIELLQLGTHREVQHSNGVPNRALALNLNSLTTIGSDGYNIQVVGPTPITAHVAHFPPGTSPVDNITNGDSVVAFNPSSNTGSIFDAQFSQVKVGDIIRLNYGLGIEDLRRVESIKYVPGTTWTVRVNGVNLRDTDGYSVFARIDRPLYDTNTVGVLAVAAANAVPLANYSILGSVIVGDPRGANAVGINFDATKITKNNYNLYLQIYPSGDPTDHVITLPGIDVTGDAGVSTGKYTLETIVQSTNNAFRATGYNYRFIAYAFEGNFGIMLADAIDGAAFAIISGSNSTGSLTESTFTHNVVGDVYGLGFDGLGFGLNNINIASPAYLATWLDSTAAQIPTKVIHPVQFRNYIVNGRPFDGFRDKPLTTSSFWAADIDARTVVGSSVEVTYKVGMVLDTAGLKPGKTIVVQPAVAFSDGTYNDVDYGRFIIKEVIFNPCQCLDEYTLITVISGIHGTGNPTSSSSGPNLPVRLYFGEDSVSFDDQNIIDLSENGTNYHRLCEIYINDTKTTFSHERARMPYQSASGSLITSNFFHIDSVSPKFRGYRDAGATLNKYIRFYVLNYNTTTGEYDGYLGQRNSADYTISKTGPIIRARKNVTARFYDDTNVDYIDITFIDDSNSSPGVTITSSPAYVDIELFDSLQLDGELLLLATCEVNWNPDTGKNIVDKVVDRKQHGSISEMEFTESAQNYIAAGERYLHGNGIIKGFDIDLNGRILGGLALVNGKFAITNSVTINIPLCTNLSAPPQTLNWIVCVNEYGNIINIPLTATKSEFFARDGYSGLIYYIESVSFIELAHRKDLTPLYIYNVTVTTTPSLVINNVSDVRKYVKDETSLIPLVWSGKDGYDTDSFSTVTELVGHFNTFAQVQNWINWTKSTRNTVKIKGSITSSTTIDFSGINYPTVFNGEEGGVFNLNNPRGLILGSNIVLKNINFNWTPGTLTYTANDNVNLSTAGTLNSDNSNACVYAVVNDTQSLKNIGIDNCNFTGTFTQTQRPPYIAIIVSGSDLIIDGVKIINNRFNDPSELLYQCSIAIASLGRGAADNKDPLLANCLIDNNISNNYQSIILSILAANTNLLASFNCINTFITRNNVGSIGYLISDNFIDINAGFDKYKNVYGAEGLRITDNTVMFIGSLDTTGHILDPSVYSSTYEIGSGDVSITGNNCSIIYCTYFPAFGIGGDNQGESLLISNNKVKAILYGTGVGDPDDLTAFKINPIAIYGLDKANFIGLTGIYVDGLSLFNTPIGYDTRVAQILNNTISYFKVELDSFLYDTAIYVDSCPAIINGNIIKSFNANGIVYVNNVARVGFVKVDITNNQIYNELTTAATYISAADGSSTKFINATIINNSFDTYQTNSLASQMIVIFGLSDRSVIKDNTNQTDIITLRAQDTGKIVYPFVSDGNNIYKDPLMDSTKIFLLNYGATSGFMSDVDPSQQFGQLSVGVLVGGGLSWVIPITLINRNTKFVSAFIRYQVYALGGSGDIKNLSLSLIQKGVPDFVALTSSVVVTATSASGTLTITIPDQVNPINIFYGDYLSVHCDLAPGSSVNVFIYFDDLIFTFRY
jgi:hypothetical protein